MQEIVGAVLMGLIALVLIVFPNQVWHVTEAWKNKRQTEPSEAYRMVMRCVGIILLVVAVIVGL